MQNPHKPKIITAIIHDEWLICGTDMGGCSRTDGGNEGDDGGNGEEAGGDGRSEASSGEGEASGEPSRGGGESQKQFVSDVYTYSKAKPVACGVILRYN